MRLHGPLSGSGSAWRQILVIGLLAAAAGCSGHDAAPLPPGAQETHDYLVEVGRIRALANADNKERIPAMIRGEDAAMLESEGARTEEYKLSLAKIGSKDVDPDALRFTRNFVAILDSYRSACADLAELFRAIKAAAVPAITFGPETDNADTLGMLNSMLEPGGWIDSAAKGGAPSLQPILSKVRDDRERLRSAKAVHHDFTQAMRAQFAERYSGLDWASKEILPRQ
jgi:hypothetical protein